MPPTNQQPNGHEIDLQSQRSVQELKDECNKLAANNDKLVNVIAQNNASKQTIIDLQKRLAYAQKNQEDKVVNFDLVNENLEHKLNEAKAESTKQDIIRDEKLKEAKELQNKKTDLKNEQKRLEDELKALEAALNQKTSESTRIASKKIMLEEEISDLKAKIEFEQHHFKLMQDALRLDDSEHASRASSQQDYQEFIDNLLRDYAKQFGKEYERLMKKAQIREKALLITKVEDLSNTNKAKREELEALQVKLKDLGAQIHQNEEKQKLLKAKLKELEDTKDKEHQNYMKEKAIRETEANRLERANDQLKDQIEKTQRNANEALKVIIELEFEIKTYEKLLKMEEQRNSASFRRDSVSSEHQQPQHQSGRSRSHSSRSSSSSSSSSSSKGSK